MKIQPITKTVNEVVRKYKSMPIKRIHPQTLVMRRRSWTLHLSENNYDNRYKKSFDQIIDYLALSPIAIKKGLYLSGPPGTGKSTLLRILKSFYKSTGEYYDCQDIVNRFNRASSNDSRYDIKIIGNRYDINIPLIMLVDDLGSEDDVREYGTTVKLMPMIINNCYQRYQRFSDRTIIASNMTLSELSKSERYDVRTTSRLYGMCHEINIKGDDSRLL